MEYGIQRKNEKLPGIGADRSRCETSDETSPDSRCGNRHTVCQNNLAQAISSDELPENSNLSSLVFKSTKSDAISLDVSDENCQVAIEYLINIARKTHTAK